MISYWHDFATAGVAEWQTFQPGTVLCTTGSPTPSSGAPTGWAPGTQCGEVAYNQWLHGYIRMKICARPGDSGGPLYGQDDHKAYGILTQGANSEGLHPSDPANQCKPNEENWYSSVSSIIDLANRIGRASGKQFRIIDHP